MGRVAQPHRTASWSWFAWSQRRPTSLLVNRCKFTRIFVHLERMWWKLVKLVKMAVNMMFLNQLFGATLGDQMLDHQYLIYETLPSERETAPTCSSETPEQKLRTTQKKTAEDGKIYDLKKPSALADLREVIFSEVVFPSCCRMLFQAPGMLATI